MTEGNFDFPFSRVLAFEVSYQSSAPFARLSLAVAFRIFLMGRSSL